MQFQSHCGEKLIYDISSFHDASNGSMESQVEEYPQ